MKWREFKIEELFQKVKVKSLKYKVSELPNVPQKGFTLPALTAGIVNQGLSCYVPREEATILKNLITISANGANTGATFYQKKEFTVLQDAYAIEYRDKNFSLSDNQHLYLAGAISKSIYGNYEWTNKAGWNRVKKNKIFLPIEQNGNIDFNFMEYVIEILKCYYDEIIKNYLTTTGLYNNKLTQEEKASLDILKETKWKKFNIKDLFSIKNTSNILSRDIKPNSGSTPYLTAKSSNNSVANYIEYDSKYLEEGNSIFIGGKTFVVTYQKDDYFSNDSHNLALYLKENTHRTELIQLFLISAIKKSMSYSYSWGYSISFQKIQNDSLLLPVNKSGKIDYKYMETLIFAIKKMVIKDVLKWLEN